jgi:hypothetical protein
MAGSNKWFVYTTDDGTDFALFRDESNMEAVNGATGDYTGSSTVTYSLPRNVKPRNIVYGNAAGTIRRTIPALTTAIYNGIAANATMTDQVSGETLTVVRKVGEVVALPKAADTGLTDGDAT